MMTVAEVAERLKMTPTTVYRWIEAGHFPGAKKTPTGLWRIPEAVVESILAPSMAAEVSEDEARDAGAAV